MRRYILLVSIALVPCTACQRDPDAPQPPDSGGSTGPPAASLPTTQHESAQPVLRWECDGGTKLTTKYLPRDRAISLGLHEGERKLPQVASASGEKYQDGPITFWRKGADAIYERTPAPSIDCRLGSGGSAAGT